jgi:hypothetical protein
MLRYNDLRAVLNDILPSMRENGCAFTAPEMTSPRHTRAKALSRYLKHFGAIPAAAAFALCSVAAHADTPGNTAAPPSTTVTANSDATDDPVPGASTNLPSPTDQPPPEVPGPRPMHFGNTAIIGGALDARYRTAGHGRTDETYLNAAEIDLTYPLVHHGVTNGNVVLQAIGEDPADIHDGSDVELGEAYVIYKLPTPLDSDSTAYVKVGQFQVPFALLAVYDPHLQISQPLYSQSLGIRNDWGIAISGRFYSVLNYDFSVTRGVGPSVIGQVDPKEVVNFRLGRTFDTRNGTINVGGSMLAGRLPNTELDAAHPFAVLLPPSGRVRADQGYINKSRIAGDATLLFKRITARGEAMVGADNDNRVLGYYAAGEYMVRADLGALIARSFWRYPLGDSYSSSDQIGVTYALSPNVTCRALYESLLDRPKDMGTNASHRFTVQVLFRF